MDEDNAFSYVRNKIEKMSKIWPQQMKNSFKEMLLKGYKIGFAVSSEVEGDSLNKSSKIDKNRGI